jgi:hypothetical protein
VSGWEELRRLEAGATNLGEWETTRNNDVVIYAPNGFGAYRLIAHADTKADAEFIVAARNQLPHLLAALDAVLATQRMAERVRDGNPTFARGWNVALDEVQTRITKALEGK